MTPVSLRARLLSKLLNENQVRAGLGAGSKEDLATVWRDRQTLIQVNGRRGPAHYTRPARRWVKRLERILAIVDGTTNLVDAALRNLEGTHTYGIEHLALGTTLRKRIIKRPHINASFKQ